MNFYEEAMRYVVADDYKTALITLSIGAAANEEECLKAIYTMKNCKIHWRDQASYLEKHFYKLGINKSYQDFVSNEASWFSPNFKRCAAALRIPPEELATYDYVNWVLEHIDNVPLDTIQKFWGEMRMQYYFDFQKRLIQNFGF